MVTKLRRNNGSGSVVYQPMRLISCATLLFVLGTALFAAGTGVSGTWAWTATPDGGDTIEGTLELKDADGALSGVLVTHEGDRITLVNPKLESDQFTFTVTVGDNTFDVGVTVAGDKFKGKFKGQGDAGGGSIEGSRKAGA
ncbi:MAG: hypothetical protein ABI693_07655 [Bryobacteraceae bacterium]